MNHAEERLLLNSELGKAIAQWGYVEGQLLQVVKRCTHGEGDAVAVAYLSIENFRSKLAFCDNLVTAKAARKQWIPYWELVRGRCTSLSSKRNQLAHGWHALYVHGPSGKRYGITPTLYSDGKLVHRDGLKPPAGTLFLRDVVGHRMDFHALTQQVCNVHEFLCGRRRPFPEADAPIDRPPTIRMLENRMRLELGRRPRPSGKVELSPSGPDLITPPSADEQGSC